MHQRKVFEIKSRQVHKDELREQPVSQETANGDSYIRKESEPPRKEETKPLPRTVPSQHPINQPQKGGHLSQEHPQSWEVRETKTKDDPSCSQTLQKRLLQGHSHAQSETRDVSALKEPAAQPAPPATRHPRGEREDVDTSSGDSEEDDVVFVSSEPGSPLLFDLTPDSQKKENLKFPGQSEQRKISPASGVCKKGEPLDPAAQRVHLTAQLKQKKSTLASVNLQALPDKGQKLFKQIQELEEALGALALYPEQDVNEKRNTQVPQQRNATKTSSDPPHLVPPRPCRARICSLWLLWD